MATSLRRASKRVVPQLQRSRGAPVSEAADAPTAHDQLVATKRSLEAVSAALNAVDPSTLSDTESRQWAEELNRVDLAIARVRNSLLNGIVQAFEAEMPSIQARTARLEADLAKFQRAVDVINAVAGVLGVFEQIITLGR